MKAKGTILSVSRHETVLRLRNAVLQQAGFNILTTRDSSEALSLLEKNAVDAVVLGDSIPRTERHLLAKKLRAAREVPVVMIYRNGEDSPLSGAAHSYIAALDSPETLVRELQRLLPTLNKKK